LTLATEQGRWGRWFKYNLTITETPPILLLEHPQIFNWCNRWHGSQLPAERLAPAYRQAGTAHSVKKTIPF